MIAVIEEHVAGAAPVASSPRKVRSARKADLTTRAEETARELLGVSSAEAFAMLDRGELEGTLAGGALESLRWLVSTLVARPLGGGNRCGAPPYQGGGQAHQGLLAAYVGWCRAARRTPMLAQEPIVTPIKNGWHASSPADGVTVRGDTEEQARRRYAEAIQQIESMRRRGDDPRFAKPS